MVLLVCLRKNNSENTSENTYTVNKVFFSLFENSAWIWCPASFRINENSANPKIPWRQGSIWRFIENPAFEYYFPSEHGDFSMLLFRGVS